MMETIVTATRGGQSSARRWARPATFVGTAVVLSALYYIALSTLERSGFLALNVAFFGEKSALALHGLPPRLVNAGFVYPPLGFLLQLPFPTPLIGQAAVSGVAMAAILDFMTRHVPGRVMRVLVTAYILASPVLLYLAIEDMSALLLALLLAASVHYITRFLRDDYSLYLFIGSTLLGLTFFVDFRSTWLLIAIVPAAAIPLWRSSRAQAISVALTISVPTLFFALAWSYVNWVFLGDPFAYVHGRGSLFRTFPITPALLAAAGDPIQTLRLAGVTLIASLPVTLPYFVGLATLRPGRPAYSVPVIVVYASPIIFIVFSMFSGLYRPTVALLAIFVLVLIFSLDAIRPTRVLAAALAISFVASFFALFYSPNDDERAFANTLTGRQAVTQNLAPFRRIAAHVGATGRILIDDGSLFPLVYVMPAPERFVLPYQYEYASALSNPAPYVQWVVVARRPEDTIYSLYPGMEFGRLPGFHETDRQPGYIVFERDGPP